MVESVFIIHLPTRQTCTVLPSAPSSQIPQDPGVTHLRSPLPSTKLACFPLIGWDTPDASTQLKHASTLPSKHVPSMPVGTQLPWECWWPGLLALGSEEGDESKGSHTLVPSGIQKGSCCKPEGEGGCRFRVV